MRSHPGRPARTSRAARNSGIVSASMSFSVHVHRDEHIIEVTYPENPTPLEIADYVTRLRQAID